MKPYDASRDIIDWRITPPHADATTGSTTAEAMSRSDNAASRWFAANARVGQMSYVLSEARYEYVRRNQ